MKRRKLIKEEQRSRAAQEIARLKEQLQEKEDAHAETSAGLTRKKIKRQL